MARNQLTESGFIDRVQLVTGDYNTDELPKGHDLGLLSAIIHSNDRRATAGFTQDLRSFAPGGQYHQDYLIRPAPFSQRAIFAEILAPLRAARTHLKRSGRTYKSWLQRRPDDSRRDHMGQLVAAVK
jgi:hypothetical protein